VVLPRGVPGRAARDARVEAGLSADWRVMRGREGEACASITCHHDETCRVLSRVTLSSPHGNKSHYFPTLPCREGFHADASVERAREMRASLAAAAVLLAVLASSAVGVGADHPRTVSRTPRFKTFARPSRAKAWVPEAHVFANKTRDTDVLDGVLAVDGTYALVVSNDQLPSLAPISSTFTIAMSLFLHDDLNVASIDAHRGIFWKGGASGDRTPSAWLIPHSNRVTYRVSTSSAEEVWGTSAAALPTRRWVHLAFSVGADRIMRLYVDGKLDSAVEIVGEVVANDGPLYLGKDAHLTGINAFIASVQMHAHALEDEDIAQAAAHALRAAPDFDGEASAEARAGADANCEARERHHRDGDAFASLLSSLPMPMHARQAAAMTSSARAEMEVRTSQARADAIANAEEKEKMARRCVLYTGPHTTASAW